MAKYTLHVNDTQLKVIRKACEQLFWQDQTPKVIQVDALSQKQIEELQQALAQAGPSSISMDPLPAVPPVMLSTEDGLVAWDIHQVLKQWQTFTDDPALLDDMIPEITPVSEQTPLAVVVRQGVRI